MSEYSKSVLRRVLRRYYLHGPGKGKYRPVNYWAPRLTPSTKPQKVIHATPGFLIQLDFREHTQCAYYQD